MAGDERRSPIATAVLIIGAAAGLAILVSLIGALVSWARFWALDLPSHAASATLTQSTLLLRGANALAGPFVAGLAAAGLTLLLRWAMSPPRRLGIAAAGAALALPLVVAAAAALASGANALYIALTGAVALISERDCLEELRHPQSHGSAKAGRSGVGGRPWQPRSARAASVRG